LMLTSTFLRAPPMEPQIKKMALKESELADMADKKDEDKVDEEEEESMEPQMKKMRFKGGDPGVDFDQSLLQGQIQGQAQSSNTKSPTVTNSNSTHESRRLKNRTRRLKKKQRAREVEEELNSSKKTEMADKKEIRAMKEKVEKLENQLAENDKSRHKNLVEQIEKLKMEKSRLQQNVEAAHVTITKNLEKIRHLEARNNCDGSEKFSEEGFMQTLSEQNTKLEAEKFEQDLSLKEEYMENLHAHGYNALFQALSFKPEKDNLLFSFEKSQDKVDKLENKLAEQGFVDKFQKRSLDDKVNKLEEKLAEKDKNLKWLKNDLNRAKKAELHSVEIIQKQQMLIQFLKEEVEKHFKKREEMIRNFWKDS